MESCHVQLSQKLLRPSKLQVMSCLLANACGRRLSLHFITLQGCTSFHLLTFHSFHCQPPTSATQPRVSPSFHCAQANPPFHSAHLRLFLLTIHITQPKREASFHQPHSLHFIQSSPLLSPTRSAVCPTE